MRRPDLPGLVLQQPLAHTQWTSEPDLAFSGGALHPDPKVGIPLYGPNSFGTVRHKNEVHVGFIGTSDSVERAMTFYSECAEGIDGDDLHVPFPGFLPDRGFRSSLRMDQKLVEPITRAETTDLLRIESDKDRLDTLVRLLHDKLRLLKAKDYPLDYVAVPLSAEILERCRVADYEVDGQSFHRDLHLAFKAKAMELQKPTQIIREQTFAESPKAWLRKKAKSKHVRGDHPAKIAWNLFTGLYFKADCLPWAPTKLPEASCFIGISFFRPLGEKRTLQASVVQAFDENGEGLVLRGHEFEWDEEKQGRSPHLTEGDAQKLISMVLKCYEDERKQRPRRVVVHKSSRFEPAERAGFESTLKPIGCRWDLVALEPNSSVRLVRAGRYPPLRGTAFYVGDTGYLYTNGYSYSSRTYPQGHVPSPVQIADHVGDTTHTVLCREIMTLTKMNWNSARMFGLLPITLRFSRLVGEVLREVPRDRTPEAKYKYYM